MNRRTVQAYESVFRYIHEKLIPLRGDSIIIDFEKPMRRALIKTIASINSNLSILGCWFHMCQSLRRKLAKTPDLFEKVRTSETHADIFRRFQCLALLPVNYIETSFISLSKEALRLDKDAFAQFIDYFNTEWIKIVTPYHFSIYMRGKRTTGDAEAFNGLSNKLFRAHASFYIFCETLQKVRVEASMSNQLSNYVNGTQQSDTRTAFSKKRSKLIKKLSLQHKDNPKLLLKALANPKNKALYADTDIWIDNGDLEMSSDIELFGNESEFVEYKEIQCSEGSDEEELQQTSTTAPR